MRRLLFSAFLAFTAIATAADSADGAIGFLEDRVRRDPEDFIAWNQLAERYHRELRRTGDDRFIDRELQAAEKSLKAIPGAQNPGGLTALAQAQLTAHRFAEARAAAVQLREILPEKTRPLRP